MKKSYLGIVLISSFLFSVTTFAESFDQTKSSIDVEAVAKEDATVNQKVRIDVTTDFSIDQQKIEVGSSAKLRVNPILGVEVEGEFKEFVDPSVQIKKDGSVIALKEGMTTITPEYTLSDETEENVKKAYIKLPGNEKLKVDDIILVKKEIQHVFRMEVLKPAESKKHQIDMTPTFSINKDKLDVGESAKVRIEPILGVELKVEYKPYKDKYIDLKKDGTITALKPTKAATIRPVCSISEESYSNIKQAYIKQEGNSDVSENEIQFSIKENAPLLSIEINKVFVPLNWTVNIDKTTIKVGEVTSFYLAPQYGYTPKGTYLVANSDIVKATKEGLITGLKPGKELISANYTFSEDEVDKIKEAFLKEKKLDNLAKEDLELGDRPTNNVMFNIEVIPTSSTNDKDQGQHSADKINPVNRTDNKKSYAPVKKLPKTGEAQDSKSILWGFLLMGGVTSFSFFRKKV